MLANGDLWSALEKPVHGVEVARVGWGAREAVAVPAADGIPGIWLCNAETGGLPPVLQRVFVPDGEVKTVQQGGRNVGVRYTDAFADYVLLMGVGPSDLTVSRSAQTTSAFENLEAALVGEGFSFKDVVRTWLYMDRILEWYDELNRARDAFFESRRIFGGFVPASTGIGSANLTGSAIMTGAIAMRPKTPQTFKAMLDSPLQCSALDYRSSFSRAAEMVTPHARTVFVSGTASIEPGGATAYLNDPKRQVALTMEVVSAILGTRNMTLRDTSRAIAYIKRPEYRVAWQEWLWAHHLPATFAQEVIADVCRDDLLFELELDAVQRLHPTQVDRG